MKRKTLLKEVTIEGIGLHKGNNIKLKLIPAENGGILFKRIDLEESKNVIELNIDNTFDLTRGTNLKNEYGACVHTIEHFLSALYILGITDLIIEIAGDELPILDGSSIKFLDFIGEDNIKTLEDDQIEIVVTKPLYFRENDKVIIALPYEGYKVTYSIKFEHTFLKSQMIELEIDYETYLKDVASARTFCFDYEIDYLKKQNLALGGGLENAIVIAKDGVLNPEGLRFENEFVRHKILDLVGDLKILNRPIRAHIIAIKAGHAIDMEMAKLLKNI